MKLAKFGLDISVIGGSSANYLLAACGRSNLQLVSNVASGLNFILLRQPNLREVQDHILLRHALLKK